MKEMRKKMKFGKHEAHEENESDFPFLILKEEYYHREKSHSYLFKKQHTKIIAHSNLDYKIIQPFRLPN